MCQNMSGLSTAEVEFRKKAGLSNESVDSSTKTVAQIIRSNVVTYYNLIFLIITILLIVVGSFRDLTFLPIIIANMLIGIIQELRSKKILDDLTILNTPKITVRRNGSNQEVLADELVQDDVITLSAGGQIPADALVLSGNITVNEALITGEADEIVKKEGDSLFSGSFVISGECMAKLEKVGKDSYISGLMLQATQTKEGEQSEMIRALNRLVQTVGVIILPIGAILFLQQYFFSGATMKDSVTGMVAAILGMIPEGLYLLASVAMVVSVMRLGKQKVLIHDMKCIETLARVNVLCVDKTGTITVPEMEVAQFILAKDQNLAAEEEKNKVAKTISDCVRALPCDNATMEALQQYFTEPMENSAEKIVPFSSATKYSGVVLAGKAYVVGAPEFVLRQDYAAVQGTIEVFLEKGYRVLVFAEYEGNLDGKELTENATPIAFILLNNAIREGAMDTFRYFSKRGVDVKVISGDNPVTVSEIAKKAGIRHAEKQVDAATLKTAEAVRKAAKEIHGVRQGDTGAETSSGAGIKRAGKDRGNDRRRRERYSCVKRCRLQHCDGIRQ
jgi:cation-transporting P-type ATPase E